MQHTDNLILEKLNRGHTVETSIKAIKLLRNHGFKVDVHIMPDLPGSNPEKDKEMMYKILHTSDFKPDYLKIYPCLDVEHTEIRNWKLAGLWKPYSEEGKGEKLLDVCMYAKQYSKYYIRFNRIQRDFPEERPGIIGYNSDNIRANFRQILQNECKKQGITCKCIRCCEVKHRAFDKNHKYFVDKYPASDGIEYFISCASQDRSVLYGFVRLRLSKQNFAKCAFIRELHVYGTINDIQDKGTENSTQHKGIGKKLMKMAEIYSYINGYTNILVISGVGVREYYKKIGYAFQERGYYMIKCMSIINFIMNIIRLFIYYILTKFNI